jgi:hypothetical protein
MTFAGVLFIAPLAIICTCIALYGSDFKSLGAISAIIIIVNFVISPTFWLNINAGLTFGGPNSWITWFSVCGSILMIGLLIQNRR